MKKLALFVSLITICTAALADPGDVIFINNGQIVKSGDAVQYKVVVQPSGGIAYTLPLSAASGANQTTLHSGALGENTTAFDVYISDVHTGTSYQKCLNDVTYSPNWAPIRIYGWYTGSGTKPNQNFACALG